jgi:transcription-repair coupling factor (superfamily II helicase)
MSALIAILPSAPIIFLPAWDCLPYDRVPPSREAMGRRMDALRDWTLSGRRKGILITSLEVLLQRIPPLAVVAEAMHELTVGSSFDTDAFREFVERTGYIVDGVVDEPGEVAMLQDVVDIFPAGATRPMRVYVTEDGKISDLRFYDPETQRTESSLETMVFGPASELVMTASEPAEQTERDMAIERRLLLRYGKLETVFSIINKGQVMLDHQVDERVDAYLAIIEEARQVHRPESRVDSSGGLYLNREDWDLARQALGNDLLTLADVSDLPLFFGRPGAARVFATFVDERIQADDTVLITGPTDRVERLTRRLTTLDGKMDSIAAWNDLQIALTGSLLSAPFELRRGFIDGPNHLVIVATDDVLGPVSDRGQTAIGIALKDPELQMGDVIVHEDHGVGILSALETAIINDVPLDAVRLDYHGRMSVLAPIAEFGKLWRYGGAPDAVTLDRLHTDSWTKKRHDIERDVRAAAQHLVDVAASRQQASAPVIEAPKAKYRSFVERFPFPVTVDQKVAIDACLEDMASGMPMNRLICGDVGYGKTEIALRAAAAVALFGKQVVVLAPTTVLARQHFSTFQRRFSGLGVTVKMMSRVMPATEIKSVKAGLADGSVDIVIATQAVLAKDVRFHALGLIIIDEEHRFGAADKERMRGLAAALHSLTMSATPIPRSLQAAMVGVQDVSLLTSPPARRRPVRMSLVELDPPSVATALRREHRRGGQSFFVVPRIEDIADLEQKLRTLVPELSLLVAHGKMPAARLDDAVVRFAEGRSDILLSTNIIENGLDIPNANTMLIWRADRFGLAQLHQLRGRVGRGRAQGYAYLLTAPGEELGEDTRDRLENLVQLDRLGSGLSIAMRDLDLRGAGDLTGDAQAGHIKKIGTGLYQELLMEAVRQLRGEILHKVDTDVDLGFFGYIPAEYIPDAMVRLSLYARLLRLAEEQAVDDLEDEISDRFGPPTEPVQHLLRITKLKLSAARIGVTKLNAGPLAMAMTFSDDAFNAAASACKAIGEAEWKGNRAIIQKAIDDNAERLASLEALVDRLATAMNVKPDLRRDKVIDAK